MILEHRCPIYEGEDALQPPGPDDERLRPWLDQLVELGIMDKDGKMLKPATLRRGIGPTGYLFRIETE